MSPREDPYPNTISTREDPYPNTTPTREDPYPNTISTREDPYPNTTPTREDPYPNTTSSREDPYPNTTSTREDPYPNTTSTREDRYASPRMETNEKHDKNFYEIVHDAVYYYLDFQKLSLTHHNHKFISGNLCLTQQYSELPVVDYARFTLETTLDASELSIYL